MMRGGWGGGGDCEVVRLRSRLNSHYCFLNVGHRATAGQECKVTAPSGMSFDLSRLHKTEGYIYICAYSGLF